MKEAIEELIKQWQPKLDMVEDNILHATSIRESCGYTDQKLLIEAFISDLTNLLKQNQ